MPPPADPRAMSEYPNPLTFSLLDRLGRRTDGNGYPHPDINDAWSLISRLTTEPTNDEAGLSAATHSSPKPSGTLVYPDPTPNPNVKPKIESLDSFAPSQPEPPTATDPRNLQMPEATVPPEKDVVEDEEQENRIPENVKDPPILSLRSPTPAPTPMMQLVDRVSALCADWSAISPDIACSTCVIDASKLSLDIHLATALTNEGLAALHTDSLIRAQTLCRMVAIMTMNGGTMTSPTTTLAENVEMLTEEYDRDAQLLFVGADPKKVRLLSVEERQAMGWQPTFDPPATPRMGTVEEMPDMDDRPDTSYDYDTELYGDGES
ncbi:hypothetical protein Moror_16819 [Moniliophthora roreri MCA 2997]|uniref:Reverse transcriptase-rnase h-integrase n=1 Tax=Moniliophthora roreri (strain MCA 2997) TaxID=1381753 RepID=V2X7Q3_MONRO|nr:hypothetical protein Moror_16819 [Moniliophthora roreri MCA 2997]